MVCIMFLFPCQFPRFRGIRGLWYILQFSNAFSSQARLYRPAHSRQAESMT